MGGPALQAGKRAKVQGLTKSPQLNDQEVVLIRQTSDRWLVEVDGKEMMLKPDNLVPIEAPAVKKARFAEAEPEEVMIEDCGDEDEDEDDDDPPYSKWANEAITIRMITGPGEEGEVCAFNPAFSHQVFHTKGAEGQENTNEELIIGYDNPQVEIVYASNDLKAWIDFKYDDQVPMKELKAANLSRTNVLSAIEKVVPSDYATKRAAVESHASASFQPIGTLVHSEKNEEAEETEKSEFRIHHFTADTPEATKYVQRLQTLVMWMIETGQMIGLPDSSWHVLTLYDVEEEDGNESFVLCGFLTFYKYWVYDKEDNSLDKFRYRVSQCVVLPPFHRVGHASRLLRSIYKIAREDSSILDITVEVPSEEFQDMRDSVEAKILKADEVLDKLADPKCKLGPIHRKYKICKSQLRRLANIAKFFKMGITDPEGDPEDKSKALSQVRLQIKADLYRQALIEAKGIIAIEGDEDEEEGDKGNKADKGQETQALKAMAAAMGMDQEAEDAMDGISKEDIDEAMSNSQMKIWCHDGDPYERKKELKSLFEIAFRKHAKIAAKLLG